MESDKKIQRMQLLEQNIQQLVAQRQQFQTQLLEIESALSELDKTSQAYRILGSIMVASSKDTIKKDLDEKKDMITIRIRNLEKQETDLKAKAKKLQEEVLKEMEQKK